MLLVLKTFVFIYLILLVVLCVYSNPFPLKSSSWLCLPDYRWCAFLLRPDLYTHTHSSVGCCLARLIKDFVVWFSLFTSPVLGLEDGSAVKAVCCFGRWPGSVPSTAHFGWLPTACNSNSRVSNPLSWSPWPTAPTCACTHRDLHIHRNSYPSLFLIVSTWSLIFFFFL